MAQLPKKGDTGFTLSGFLILAALGAFLWKGAPLESVRPSSEQSGWYERQLAQQVPARLWQDPFKAVHTHEQAIKDKATSLTYQKPPHLRLIEIPDSVDGKIEISLLLVQVAPGSYAEIEERRRRRRYAVLSGLAEEHFVPRNPEVLNVFYQPSSDSRVGDSTDRPCFPENHSDKPYLPSKYCYAVPYEWFDYEDPEGSTNKQHQVLVLWLDESRFVDSPLNHIKNLLEDLLAGVDSTRFTLRATLLGPARSNALRNLVTKNETDAYEWLGCCSGLAEFNIISSTATVADDDLLGRADQGRRRSSEPSPLINLQNKITEKYRQDGRRGALPEMNFLRTIQSDEELIRQLAHELKNNRMISAKDDYVVVISEWDTYFGRSLPRAFSRHFCGKDDCDANLVQYSYQRGMDGIVAGQQSSAERSQNGRPSGAGGLTGSVDATRMRRPVGTGQFDYLRRLAADINTRDREWRMETGHGVRAVVLLGSDVYDKLLILRALRPELPGALFATTDLDAQLLHPAEYNWTRSLIIASTYNFRLSALTGVPLTTMPFRDSYQTSIYLATRLIFNEQLMNEVSPQPDDTRSGNSSDARTDQQRMYSKIPAQLFEVGRHRLVPLTTEASDKSTWNQVVLKSFAAPVAYGLFAIAVLAIVALHQLRPMAGRAVAASSLLLLLFAILAYVVINQGPGGEPLALLAGASIWPTQFIRVFAVLLSLVFIWLVIHHLHKNWCALGQRYFWGGDKNQDDGLTIHQFICNIAIKLRHPIRTVRKIKPTQIAPLLMLVILFLVMKEEMPEARPLSEKIWHLVVIWVVLIGGWWITIYGWVWKGLQVRSINQWSDNASRLKEADKMWTRYGEYGASDHRFLRTIAYVLIYFAFASFLFTMLGSPTSPCRGAGACTMDKITLSVSVLAMLVLLFLVVDAARLCICWADSLRDKRLDWKHTQKDKFVQRLRLPETHAIVWIKVHLIGERTSEITRLIYYPVLIILLLLLARSTYFDKWDFPQALGIVVALNFIIALGSIMRLNFVAHSVRDEILRNLENENLANDRKQQPSYPPSSSERQELIRQLKDLRIGAYMRIWDQPPIRATLMLLGGIALTYAEYLNIFVP